MSNNEFKDLIDNGVWALTKSLKLFLEKYQDMEENTNQSTLSIDERSQLIALYQVQNKLEDAYHQLKKLSSPVIAEGRLKKNSINRYEVNGVELTSGSYVEYLSEDEDGNYYIPSSIEHNGEDYYIVNLGRDKKIEGLQVRIK